MAFGILHPDVFKEITRMHSSRMRTTRFSARLGCGGSAQGGGLPRGVYPPPPCLLHAGIYPCPCEQNHRRV